MNFYTKKNDEELFEKVTSWIKSWKEGTELLTFNEDDKKNPYVLAVTLCLDFYNYVLEECFNVIAFPGLEAEEIRKIKRYFESLNPDFCSNLFKADVETAEILNYWLPSEEWLNLSDFYRDVEWTVYSEFTQVGPFLVDEEDFYAGGGENDEPIAIEKMLVLYYVLMHVSDGFRKIVLDKLISGAETIDDLMTNCYGDDSWAEGYSKEDFEETRNCDFYNGHATILFIDHFKQIKEAIRNTWIGEF